MNDRGRYDDDLYAFGKSVVIWFFCVCVPIAVAELYGIVASLIFEPRLFAVEAAIVCLTGFGLIKYITSLDYPVSNIKKLLIIIVAWALLSIFVGSSMRLTTQITANTLGQSLIGYSLLVALIMITGVSIWMLWIVTSNVESGEIDVQTDLEQEALPMDDLASTPAD